MSYDAEPCWSPDGLWVAFISDGSSGRDIDVVRADDPDSRRSVTSDPRFTDESPSW
jgi:Tol biopolymer transport system component